MREKIIAGLVASLLLVNALYFIGNMHKRTVELNRAQDYICAGDKYLSQQKWIEASAEYSKAEAIFIKRGETRKAGEMGYFIKQLDIIKELTSKKERPAPVAGISPLKKSSYKDKVKIEPSQKAAALKKVIDAKIVNIDAYFNLANTYYDLGRYPEAEEAYEKVLSVQPGDFQAYNGIGNCNNAMGEYTKAITAYQASIKIKADNFNAYNNMGNTYRHMNENSQALAAYQKALTLKPDSADVYYNLGITHGLLGEKEQAKEMLLRAERLYKGRNNKEGQSRVARALASL